MFFRANGAPVELVNLFQGRAIFIVCNGPSFSNTNWSLLRKPGILTFGMNNGAHLFRPNLWAALDDPVRFMESIWRDAAILKFVPVKQMFKPIWIHTKGEISRDLVRDYPNVIGFRRNERFDAEQWLSEPTINWGNHADLAGGRSVMLPVLRIAYVLGFRKAFLIGCDFQMDEARKYWFPEDRSPNAISNSAYSYTRLREYFRSLQPKFLDAGFHVYNCTPGSRLEAFPFQELEAAVAEHAIDLSESTYGMYCGASDSAVGAESD